MERLVTIMDEIFGLSISEGAISNIWRVIDRADPVVGR
jgi:hypothetical protein